MVVYVLVLTVHANFGIVLDYQRNTPDSHASLTVAVEGEATMTSEVTTEIVPASCKKQKTLAAKVTNWLLG